MKKQIQQIACGSSHTLLLTVDGAVYAAGNNCAGQLVNGYFFVTTILGYRE